MILSTLILVRFYMEIMMMGILIHMGHSLPLIKMGTAQSISNQLKIWLAQLKIIIFTILSLFILLPLKNLK